MRTSKRRSTNDCLIYRNFRLLSHFVHSDIWTYDISLREVKNSNQTLEIVVYKGALITVMHHKINTHLHCRNHTHLGMVFLLARGIGMLQQSINCLLALAHASHWANRLHSSQWMYLHRTSTSCTRVVSGLLLRCVSFSVYAGMRCICVCVFVIFFVSFEHTL